MCGCEVVYMRAGLGAASRGPNVDVMTSEQGIRGELRPCVSVSACPSLSLSASVPVPVSVPVCWCVCACACMCVLSPACVPVSAAPVRSLSHHKRRRSLISPPPSPSLHHQEILQAAARAPLISCSSCSFRHEVALALEGVHEAVCHHTLLQYGLSTPPHTSGMAISVADSS